MPMDGREVTGRLRTILLQDKIALPQGFDALLATEVGKTLSEYMTLSQGLTVRTELDASGYYVIKITARASSLSAPHIVPKR